MNQNLIEIMFSFEGDQRGKTWNFKNLQFFFKGLSLAFMRENQEKTGF